VELLLISDREHSADWLRNALKGRAAVNCCAPGPAAAVLAQADRIGAQLLLVDLGGCGAESERVALVRTLADVAREGQVVACVGDDEMPHTLLGAVRAGARDYLRIDSPAQEVAALLERVAPNGQRYFRRVSRWFAVLDARPSVDTTLFATHLALALREAQPGGRTLLLDLGLPAGDAPLIMGVPSGFTVVDALANVRRLDDTLIDTAFARHSSGLLIVSLPPDLAPVLGGEDLSELAAALDGHFDQVILNLGGWTDPELLRTGLYLSERTLFVVEATVPSCRSARALLDRLGGVAVKGLGMVVDRTDEDMQSSPSDIAKGLGLPLWGGLPASVSSRKLVLNRGESMYALRPNDPYAVCVQALGRALLAGSLGGAGVSEPLKQSPRERLRAAMTALRGRSQ
jgi:pilus assembly protein CpaE